MQSPRRLLHSRTVYCTLAPPSIALSRRRQSHSRSRQRRLRHTYFLVSVRCFSEEKVRSAVLVGNSVVSVIVLAPLSIKLTPPTIALVPRRRQSYPRRAAVNRTRAAPPSIALRNKKTICKVIHLNRISIIDGTVDGSSKFPSFLFC